jgi:hypothetical protein
LELIAKLSIDPVVVPGFSLHNGILKFHDRIWVGSNRPLQDNLLKACHASAIGGHSGIPVTYRRMKKLFSWKGMKADVVQFVSTCFTCQQAKSDRAKLPGKLQPLPVPDSAW